MRQSQSIAIRLAVILFLGAQTSAADPESIQRKLDHTNWSFNANESGIIASLRKSEGHAVSFTTDATFLSKLTISVLGKDGPIHSWNGGVESVFQVTDDVLYYIDYSSSTSGGTFVVVDLKTGKEVWTSPLQAIGPVGHSKYFNAITFEINFPEALITVHGQESFGNYIECKDLATGRTIAHRVYPPAEH